MVLHVEPMVSLSPADVGVACVAPKKKARAPSHIWTDEETGVFFLSLWQGDETTIRYCNRMKLNLKKKKRSQWRRLCRKSPGSWEQRASVWQQSAATVSSPFFSMVVRDEWPVAFDYAIVIQPINSMLKNSIHSIQNLMNGPTVEGTTENLSPENCLAWSPLHTHLLGAHEWCL